MSFDIDPSQLPGPDFLHAVADAEEGNGNTINAAEFRRRAHQWQRDQDLAATAKPRVRVPVDQVTA